MVSTRNCVIIGFVDMEIKIAIIFVPERANVVPINFHADLAGREPPGIVQANWTMKKTERFSRSSFALGGGRRAAPTAHRSAMSLPRNRKTDGATAPDVPAR
jgi:hypothetical protein